MWMTNVDIHDNGLALGAPGIQPISAKHGSSLRFTDGILTDENMEHVCGPCYLGMADTGEILDSLSRLNDCGPDVWGNAWSDIASRLEAGPKNAQTPALW